MKYTFLIVILIFAGCERHLPQKTSKTSNNIKIEVLFTDEDGYTVKRFKDNGKFRYYVTPEGSVSVSRNREEIIQTIR